jgi:hypothetical protein
MWGMWGMWGACPVDHDTQGLKNLTKNSNVGNSPRFWLILWGFCQLADNFGVFFNIFFFQFSPQFAGSSPHFINYVGSAKPMLFKGYIVLISISPLIPHKIYITPYIFFHASDCFLFAETGKK